MKGISIDLLLLWTLCSSVLSEDHYCPENGETKTINIAGSTRIKTIFKSDSEYRQNQNCRWIISAGSDTDMRIMISVDESDLQYTPDNADCTKYDYMELRDGMSASSPLLKMWCGIAAPYTVISKSNVMYVSFSSEDIHLTLNRGVTLDISTFSVGPSASCPPGWISPPDSSTSCYSIKTHAETWKDAQGFCYNDQANLVSLTDSDKQDYVLEQARTTLTASHDDVWIGLNDIVKDDLYVWVDGASSTDSFTSSKVPSQGQQYKDCMLVNINTGEWSEAHCDRPETSTSKYPFVCERKRDGTSVAILSPPVEAITYYCKNDGKILYISNAETARIQTRVEGTSTYGKDLNCKWIINSGHNKDKRIHLNVTKSDLQWTPSDAICFGYDHVEVRDGPSEDSALLSTFCGTMNPYSLISSSNVLYISFISGDRQVYSLPGVTLDFTFFSVAPSKQECPPGWFSDGPSGKYCYSIKTHAETWVDAQRYCNHDQGNLVSLETQAESDFVVDYAVQTLRPLQYRKMWIGLNDIAKEGDMVWIDGIKSSAKSKRQNQAISDTGVLAKAYVSSLYEDCIVVRLDDRSWAEEFCTNYEVQTTIKYPFVCKRTRDGSTTLFDVPRAKAEKEGPKGNLAPKPLIIFGVVVAILAVVGLGALGLFCYKKKQEADRQQAYSPPSQPRYQTPEAPPMAEATQISDQPPAYEEAMEISMKGTPL